MKLATVGASGALVGAGGALVATAHTGWNLRRLRIPPADPPPVPERVSVLLPVRNEAPRVAGCLRAVSAQTGVPDLEILVYDDGSTDDSADIVRRAATAEPRIRLLTGAPLPAGWLGKPHACAQLAAAATGSVLVFLDADVVLAAPTALAATVTVLRHSALHLVSPYPRQLASGPAPRLIQPLLQWSWLTFLPLRLAERSTRPSLAAANGQLLAVDAAAYRKAGGHAGVRTAVIDDVALLRAVIRAGGCGGMVDGTALATCQMYADWSQLREGYTKSLWSAFGSPAGAAAVLAVLTLLYVVPPAAAVLALVRRRPRAAVVPVVGYAAGVGGRALTGRRTGARVWPDALAHPASVALLAALTAQSWQRRRAGTLTWKGRVLA